MADSIGAWATDWARSAPFAASLALWGIAVAKVVAALVPLLSELGLVPGRPVWRVISWIGGAGIALYGGQTLRLARLFWPGSSP